MKHTASFLVPLSAVILLSLLMAFGCNRTIDSTDPVRTLPDAPSTPINVSATLDTQSVTLSWEVPDTAVVKRFRIYLTDSSGANARLRDSTMGVSFSQTLTGLALNQTVYFRVATVGREGIEGLRSTPPLRVRVAPMSILIENGNIYTNRRNVTIQVNAPSGAADIKLSENEDLAGAVFQPFSSQMSFTLSDGDGVKLVFAQLVFDDGTQTGVPLVDGITLDTRARIDTVYFRPPSTIFTSGSAIDFRLRSGETGGTARISFPGENGVALYDDGSGIDSTANDGVYAARYIVPLAMTVKDGQVTGLFTDAAGNQAPARTAYSLLNIEPVNQPPTAVVLAGNSDSTGAHLTWSQNGDSDFAMYRLYRSTDTTRAVDTTSQLVAILNTQSTTSYDDAVLRSYPALAYRIYVFDQLGRATPSNKVVVIR
ncbi:hypothetical protein C3F09_00035 [candidate division GN15 bacterium]|uniref:Fibronectin type-III domain-containing protein n=1 Tax=candidate division GN15 bacterium TaxID=2072418 RepID=A0A855X847_9BACT|nr:MAG: hypothetical protein C3F09_00035 [candidate division GN15 bacterium]